MNSPACVVLDLDGTISDPAIGIGRSINYALEHFGYPAIPEATVSVLIGPPLDHTFRSITGVSSVNRIAELVAKYRERYAKVGYSENVLYPHIPEALDFLSTAGVPLGLCTSKRIDFAERILRMFGLRHHFGFLSGGDIGISKAHQLGALLADGVISTSSLMVGDRAIDIEAAKEHNLGSVGVLWGHGTENELLAAKPSRLLKHPLELKELQHAV